MILLEINNYCSSPAIANLLFVLKNIFNVTMIIAPILAIVVLTITFTKIIANPEEKKLLKKLKNSLLALTLVFLVSIIVNVSMSLLDNSTDISNCWNHAKQINSDSKFINQNKDKKKKSLYSPEDYEKGIPRNRVNMNYSDAKDLTNDALKSASHSDPSVVVVDDEGNVLAERKAHVLREGGSTTKLFTGYAAVNLLDVNNDKVVGYDYITNFVGNYNNHSLAPNQKITVLQAASRGFPGSSNTAAEAIAVAIGYKLTNPTSVKDAHLKGIEEINKFIKTIGCNESNLGNGSGLDFAPHGRMKFSNDGYPKDNCHDGHTANDLAIVAILAMKDENFLKSYKSNTSSNNATLAENKSKNGLFFIKSGTGYLCHGIWGFNYKGKRYYISLLGINCRNGEDNKYQVAKDIQNWTINNLIK